MQPLPNIDCLFLAAGLTLEKLEDVKQLAWWKMAVWIKEQFSMKWTMRWVSSMNRHGAIGTSLSRLCGNTLWQVGPLNLKRKTLWEKHIHYTWMFLLRIAMQIIISSWLNCSRSFGISSKRKARSLTCGWEHKTWCTENESPCSHQHVGNSGISMTQEEGLKFSPWRANNPSLCHEKEQWGTIRTGKFVAGETCEMLFRERNAKEIVWGCAHDLCTEKMGYI